MTEQEKKIDEARKRALSAHHYVKVQEGAISQHVRLGVGPEHLFVRLRSLERSFVDLCKEGLTLDPQMVLPVHVPKPAWEYDHV